MWGRRRHVIQGGDGGRGNCNRDPMEAGDDLTGATASSPSLPATQHGESACVTFEPAAVRHRVRH